MTNPHEILGVNENASKEEIRKAYLKMMEKWHPDRNPDNQDEAKKRLQEVIQAYQSLSNGRIDETNENLTTNDDTPAEGGNMIPAPVSSDFTEVGKQDIGKRHATSVWNKPKSAATNSFTPNEGPGTTSNSGTSGSLFFQTSSRSPTNNNIFGFGGQSSSGTTFTFGNTTPGNGYQSQSESTTSVNGNGNRQSMQQTTINNSGSRSFVFGTGNTINMGIMDREYGNTTGTNYTPYIPPINIPARSAIRIPAISTPYVRIPPITIPAIPAIRIPAVPRMPVSGVSSFTFGNGNMTIISNRGMNINGIQITPQNNSSNMSVSQVTSSTSYGTKTTTVTYTETVNGVVRNMRIKVSVTKCGMETKQIFQDGRLISETRRKISYPF